MTIGQPTMVRHTFPWGLELLGAAILGAIILFGVLVAIGHTDLLPWTADQAAATWMSPEFQAFRQGEILGR